MATHRFETVSECRIGTALADACDTLNDRDGGHIILPTRDVANRVYRAFAFPIKERINSGVVLYEQERPLRWQHDQQLVLPRDKHPPRWILTDDGRLFAHVDKEIIIEGPIDPVLHLTTCHTPRHIVVDADRADGHLVTDHDGELVAMYEREEELCEAYRSIHAPFVPDRLQYLDVAVGWELEPGTVRWLTPHDRLDLEDDEARYQRLMTAFIQNYVVERPTAEIDLDDVVDRLRRFHDAVSTHRSPQYEEIVTLVHDRFTVGMVTRSGRRGFVIPGVSWIHPYL